MEDSNGFLSPKYLWGPAPPSNDGVGQGIHLFLADLALHRFLIHIDPLRQCFSRSVILFNLSARHLFVAPQMDLENQGTPVNPVAKATDSLCFYIFKILLASVHGADLPGEIMRTAKNRAAMVATKSLLINMLH